MLRCSQRDIAAELVELCWEIAQEILQELTYYKVSVYKLETRDQIAAKIQKAREVAALLGCQEILEPFADFDASGSQVNMVPHFSECSFSSRVGRLVKDLQEQLKKANGLQEEGGAKLIGSDITVKVLSNRQRILSMCQHGSRHWEFFATL